MKAICGFSAARYSTSFASASFDTKYPECPTNISVGMTIAPLVHARKAACDGFAVGRKCRPMMIRLLR